MEFVQRIPLKNLLLNSTNSTLAITDVMTSLLTIVVHMY